MSRSMVLDRHLLPIADDAGSGGEVAGVDTRELAQTLMENVEGEVRFDSGTRALYATDGSNYRMPPIGVVLPRSLDDVEKTVAICRGYGAPILSRGGGTSLAGQCCNTAVVMDFSKYLNRVLEIDAPNRRARVQPGCVLDTLRDAANAHDLTFGPDPSTHDHNTLGGMIGNNSCGVHSIMSALYGPGARTSDNVEALEVLTHDGLRMKVGATSEEELESIIREGGRRGEIYGKMKALRDRYAPLIREKYPKIPRRVSGYNLDDLLPENGFNVARALSGSEGTLVTILEATLTLIEQPRATSLTVLGYPDVYQAGDHVPDILEFQPIALEAMDALLVEYMQIKGLHTRDVGMLPKGGGWLLVEFGGDTREEAEEKAERMIAALKKRPNPPTMKIFHDPDEAAAVWLVRRAGLGATAWVPGMEFTWPGWEDTAVHPNDIGAYLRDFRKLLTKYGYGCSLYGHMGQGLIHVRIDFGLRTPDEVKRYARYTREGAELVVNKYNGTLSGEHGDGQARGDLLPIMFGEELVHAFEEFKSIWDPEWKMNPGKVVKPNPRISDLRLGADYEPWDPHTHFKFPDDHGSFARAALRCVGVGECRRNDGGTMCPSYMVTHEEEHATRGRAHLLFEMLQGNVVTEGWKSDSVKEALDLCLACKGCLGDCPVNVDMATYKAEFLSHYYDGRARPRHAYAFGLIQYWARLAEQAPDVANLLTHAPGVERVAKWVAGIAQERTVPTFAPRTFKRWFRERGPRNPGGKRVILWPDTFNDHFYPEILQAGTEVLEDAGYRVVVPEQWICCGRPLYDFGMLDLAEHQLRRVLDVLEPEIAAGTPIVGLEPSCTAVLRHELYQLMPDDERARKLKEKTLTLGEFLMGHAEGYNPPELHRHAFVHGHCHHKSVMTM
ncbi:MAG TPA: FAD-binding and (Fe-S)-binding domain-containing protein, partial [Longimicrobiaceae bacterium]|nr:FAD-binding and (Fe-S)-binding domain-containing protein [Longimicrobiaceae bacterium]